MTTEHKEVGFTKVLTDGKLDFIICHGCSKHLDISNIERQAKAEVFEDLDNLLDNFIRNVVGFKEKYNKLKEKHLGGE